MRFRRMYSTLLSVSMITIGLFGVGQAAAADDDALVRILTKAFLAQNFAAYCAQFNPDIANTTRGKEGNISQLVQHIRSDVIEGLSKEDAEIVIRRSADAARAGALLAIRRFYQSDLSLQRQEIAAWCTLSIPSDIVEYVQDHDGQHDQFDRAIAAAKKAP
ncbi:MAG: hypothetical protein ABII76_14870 [Pseudomonadota bacterium]